MKKLLGILVLGLLWCNVGFAEKDITGFKKIEKSMPLKKVDRIKTVKKSDGFPVYEGETSIQVTVNREDAGCGKFDATDKGHTSGACDGKYNRSRQEYKLGNDKSKLKNKEYIYEWAMYFDENYESLKKKKKLKINNYEKIKIILNHKEEYRNLQLRRSRLKIKKYKNKFAFFTPALSPLIRA